MEENKIFMQYIRQENRRPIGLACATVSEGKLKVGFTLESRPQIWDKKLCRKVAIGRMYKSDVDYFDEHNVPSNHFYTDLNIEMPSGFGISEQLDSFVNSVKEKLSLENV